MKKLFFVIAMALLAATPSASAAEKLIITHAAGTPQVIRGSEVLEAKVGMICQTGDTLKTPTPECQIDLSMNNIAGCRVLPSSEVKISGGSQKDMKVEITSGNAILNLKKLPKDSTFRVETPTAVAAVRGTQFWGRVDGQSPASSVTTFAVREGVVNIFSKKADKTFSLQKGQALDLSQDNTAPEIRPALEAELQALAQASSIKTSA